MKSLAIGRAFLRNPTQIGAIAPSSAVLAECITSEIDIERAGSVVEYGVGTGVFTRAILRKLAPEASYCGFEIDPELAARFRRDFPGVNLSTEDVVHAPRVLAEAGIAQADCIVSGLPWAAFPEQTQRRILSSTMAILAPAGHFATFAYLQGVILPAGKRFRRLLDEHFAVVERSRVVWRNLPPAFVYRCRKPLSGA
jgi:phosphatidylethanolamine/phosphatidyl-N-methylethanolamine N-methyltransferase